MIRTHRTLVSVAACLALALAAALPASADCSIRAAR